MFNDVIGKWKYSEKILEENIHDSVGTSLKQSLFNDGQQKLVSMENQYLEAEQQKQVINNLLCELRRII